MAIDTSIAIVTMDEAKEFIKKSDDTDLNSLEAIINGICGYFKARTGRIFPSATYTDLYMDGNGWPDIWLPNWPVTALTSLYEDDSLLIEDTDFYLDDDTGKLSRVATSWPSELGLWKEGRKTIKITYTAGYSSTTMPKDLKMACLIQVSDFWVKFIHKSWGETSRSLASQSVSSVEDSYLPLVISILDSYKRIRG